MRIANSTHLSTAACVCLVLSTTLVTTHAASYAFTQPAGPISNSNATLNAMVVPNGLPSVAWFEWGLRGGYGQATSPVDVGNTGRVVRVSTPIEGLTEGGVYQFRTVLSNSAGSVYGYPHLFTTGGSQKVAVWGYRGSGQAMVPAGLASAVAIEGGDYHSLALKSDGTVAAWGANEYGETNLPPGLSNVVQLSAWGSFSLALKFDGTVTAWGIPNTKLDYGLTNLPTGLTNVISIAVGWKHALALRADGSVVAWGCNDSGQRNIPMGLSNVVAVTLGDDQSLALKVDGTLWAWGYSGSGLGDVGWVSNVVAIAGGAHHYVALKADGTVAGWGQNAYGVKLVPAGLSNVIAVASGSYSPLVLKADGSVATWGDNSSGATTNIPVGLSNAVAIAGGDFHSVVLAPNVPPQTSTRSVTNVVNCDLTASPSCYDPNNDPLTYRVVSLPALGALYQYAGGVRGPAIAATDTAITDSQGRVIFAPETDGVGFPYTAFDIVANDGEADSLPATVIVNVIPRPVLEVSSAGVGTNGAFSLSFAGFTNATYRVWASTNLTNWSVLGAATQSGPGLFRLSDAAATNWSQRFYRVTSP